MTIPKKRTCIYIDGFNLYRGAIAGTAHKWLNIQKFFELLRPDDDIVAINYFTSVMVGQQGDRQQIYLRALATLPKLRVILGKYKTKRVLCNIPLCTHSGDRMIVKWEEKRTDVNIAIRILDDAYQDVSDNIVLVSGDSDLVPALLAVKSRFPHKRLIVYVPARDRIRGAAVEIRSAADRNATLPLDLLPKAQFPSEILDGDGNPIRKPPGW